MAVNKAGRNLEYKTRVGQQKFKFKILLPSWLLSISNDLVSQFPPPDLVSLGQMFSYYTEIFGQNWTPHTHIQHTHTDMHIHTHCISMTHFSSLTTSVYFLSCLMTQDCHDSQVQSRARTQQWLWQSSKPSVMGILIDISNPSSYQGDPTFNSRVNST